MARQGTSRGTLDRLRVLAWTLGLWLLACLVCLAARADGVARRPDPCPDDVGLVQPTLADAEDRVEDAREFLGDEAKAPRDRGVEALDHALIDSVDRAPAGLPSLPRRRTAFTSRPPPV